MREHIGRVLIISVYEKVREWVPAYYKLHSKSFDHQSIEDI